MSNNATNDFTPAHIDWCKEWTHSFARSSITLRRSTGSSYWEKRADRFSSMDNGAEGRVQAILDRIGVDNETTILDIGCGPGNLAVPLAKSAHSVTALDPSKSMLEKLKQRATREAVTNIRCIDKEWDRNVLRDDIVPHDIVLSSYSLIMKDIGEALEAMNDAAERTVCIFWFAGRECFGYDRFWPALFDEEFIPGPDHAILLNILNSMQIYPEVSIIPQQHVICYADMDDAVECWSNNLYISTQREKDIIRKTLNDILCTLDGKPAFTRNVLSTMIWWKKK